MSEPQLSQPTTPRKCVRGCGFFGRPENKFLCSKCYDDYLKEDIVKSFTAVTPTSTCKPPQDSAATSGGATSTANRATVSTAAPAKSYRCFCCKKKVGLMGFRCRCGRMFCGRHRYAEEHKCEFDFKAMVRNILAKENPAMVADKLHDRV